VRDVDEVPNYVLVSGFVLVFEPAATTQVYDGHGSVEYEWRCEKPRAIEDAEKGDYRRWQMTADGLGQD
jgi:hypothetical protein